MINCPVDGTPMNFITITQWWVDQHPELNAKNIGKVLSFCSATSQHYQIGTKPEKPSVKTRI